MRFRFEESDDDGRSGSCEVGCRIRNRWREREAIAESEAVVVRA